MTSETEVGTADDVAAAEYDPQVDDIDFEEIYQSTQADFEAGRYAFNSADYATHEEAMEAMRALIHSIGEEVRRRNAAANPPLDAEG
jgi:hypothetical protein